MVHCSRGPCPQCVVLDTAREVIQLTSRSGAGVGVFGVCRRALHSLPAAPQGGLVESPRRGLFKGPAPPLEVKQEDR